MNTEMQSAIPAPSQLLDFSGKTVMITGAGSGIGTGIALRFAQAGAKVVIGYRNSESGAAEVVAAVQKSGGQALAVRADVSTADGAQLLVQQAVDAFGAVEVLINNAGSYPLAGLMEMTPEQWDDVINDNLRSVHLCTQAAARHMAAHGKGGAVVNIASIEAANPAPLHAHYDTAKAGVVMYTRSAAQELGAHGIRVNCVSPGLIWREGLDEAWPDGVNAYTRAVPLKRLGRYEDVADACLFLASPAARWITGAELVVDGGVMTHRTY
jgi:NAD(P)-dependent dehydrogenase (short-subunit alcohol dehydrogenase family)